MATIIQGENLEVLPSLPDGGFELIYIDPPFNTGREQRHTRIKIRRDERGDRVGFAGRRYQSTTIGSLSFGDVFDDFPAFLEPRLHHAHRLLAPRGSFFLHIDYREAHYCKVLLDAIFGRACFLNEIIWAYDYGGRPKRRWPAKHDTILWYARDPKHYTFNYDAIDRIPYMAPRLVGKEKAARGKTPTDVWWQTIVPTAGRERTGYPTQKPLKILERIVAVHSNPGDRVLDFFAGSGTTGEAAARAGRDFVLIDHSSEAVAVMEQRLAFAEPEIERRDSDDALAIDECSSDDGSPDDGSPDDGSSHDGSPDDGSSHDGSSDDGSSHDGSSDDGSSDDGSSDDGSSDDGSPDDGSSHDGSPDDGSPHDAITRHPRHGDVPPDHALTDGVLTRHALVPDALTRLAPAYDSPTADEPSDDAPTDHALVDE